MIPNILELVTKMDVPMQRAPMPRLNALNHLGWLLSKTPCITLARPLNITLTAIDNKVSGIADTRLGISKAIIANTIARIPRPIFVRGVTFLLRPDCLVAFGKDEYSFSSIIPVATLSTPIVNNVIESSAIIVFTARTGKCIANRYMDNISDIMPLPICRARNHVGG